MSTEAQKPPAGPELGDASWERHRYQYGWVCSECGYHGRHQIGREIHERNSWPEKCATWKQHFAENAEVRHGAKDADPN